MPYSRSNYKIHTPYELMDAVISMSALIDRAVGASAIGLASILSSHIRDAQILKSHHADGNVSTSALAGAAIQASHGVLGVFLRSHFAYDSFYTSFSDFVTVSMGGYGAPGLLAIIGISQASGADASVPIKCFPTQSFSGSIGWIYVYQSNVVMTGTARVLFMGLIASR